MESKNVFGLAAFVALMLGPVSHAVGQVARSPDSGPATASTLADLAEIQLRRLTYEALTGMNEAKLAYEKTSRVEDRSATGVPTVRSVQGIGGSYPPFWCTRAARRPQLAQARTSPEAIA